MLGSSVAFVFFAFLTLTLLCILAPYHFNSYNAGTSLIIGWTSLGMLCEAISCLIFMNATHVIVPSWCDLAAAVRYLWGTGAITGCLVLLRRLMIIAKSKETNLSHKQRITCFITELVIGIIIPLLQVLLHYIVQPHRLNEFKDIGCLVPIYPDILAVILVMVYPLIVTLISATYGVLAVTSLMKRRRELREIIRVHGSGLSKAQYFRLMFLGLSNVGIWLPLTLSFFFVQLHTHVRAEYSWSYIHSKFHRILFFTLNELPSSTYFIIELTRWMGPFSAGIFYLFFGIKAEVWDQLKKTIKDTFSKIKRGGKNNDAVSSNEMIVQQQ